MPSGCSKQVLNSHPLWPATPLIDKQPPSPQRNPVGELEKMEEKFKTQQLDARTSNLTLPEHVRGKGLTRQVALRAWVQWIS